MEAMALKESGRKAEMELQQQLSSAREELQLTSQNTEVMREALQVNCLLSLKLLIPSTKNCVCYGKTLSCLPCLALTPLFIFQHRGDCLSLRQHSEVVSHL